MPQRFQTCWPFDDALEPIPDKRALKCNFNQSKLNEESDVADKLFQNLPFVPGKSGKGIDLSSDVALSYSLDTKGFPLKEGSLLFWFKPHETLGQMRAKPHYFIEANWAGFSVSMGMAYCTSDNAKFQKWPELIPSVGDYSYPALRHFEKVTGIKGPVWPPDKAAGTVFPDDEPYLKWKNTIGLVGDTTGEGFDRVYQRLAAVIKEKRPDIKASNYSGGEYGYLDAVADWQYPYIWEPRLSWGGSGHGLLDFCFDRHRARQKEYPRKPLWALLGWWSVDMSKAGANWWLQDFRLNTEIALSKGVKMLEWFYPGDKGNEGYLGTPEGKTEFEKWCAWLYKNGPVFRYLEPPAKGTIAVLLSEINTAGKTRRAPGYAVPYDLTLTALRIAGAEPILVTDDMVLQGALDSCSGLVLLDNDYSSQSVWKRIEDFAAQPGKTVFYDKSSALYPANATALDFSFKDRGPKGAGNPQGYLVGLAYQSDSLRKILSDKLLSSRCQISGSDLVVPYWLEGGKATYLFLVNYDWKEAQKLKLSLNNGGKLYDILSKQEVPLESSLEIGPADWMVFVLLPQSVGGLQIEAKCKDKCTIEIVAVLKGADGKKLEAALPLDVKIISPDAIELPYAQPTAFDAQGEWKSSVRLSDLMDKPGVYRVEIEELMSGKKASAEVSVPKQQGAEVR